MSSVDTSNFLIAESQLALDKARKEKSHRTKDLGSPIQLTGKALAIHVHGNNLWVAENTSVARKIDLESGKTLQIYRGHTGPLTTLAFCDKVPGSNDGKILITGSWDRTIKLWDIETKELLSSTDAHTDFVKSLFVLHPLNLLVSGGSDKVIRFWNLSLPNQRESLINMGSISSHTRPVECLDGKALSDTSALLYTADTMGIIKIWNLTKDNKSSPRWQSVMKEEYNYHRTRINDMIYGSGHLWTASSDETVKILPDNSMLSATQSPVPFAINHPVAVRAILPLSMTDLAEPYLIIGAGDIIRIYDISTLEEPELLKVIDAHWHDVTAIRLWIRKYTSDDNKTRIEPWIVSASLDSTIRKWKLSELLDPPSSSQITRVKIASPRPSTPSDHEVQFHVTDEEERELAELLGSE